jgi:hypothetical protein
VLKVLDHTHHIGLYPVLSQLGGDAHGKPRFTAP